MSYIINLVKGTIIPKPNQISLERYIQESSFITRYLSRLIKDKSLAVYHVLFMLSWFENGKGEVVIPWSQVGSFILSEQGHISDGMTVRRRLPLLIENKCIVVNRQRGGANEISICLPSDIPNCRKLIEKEEQDTLVQTDLKDERDYFNDIQRRLVILDRDSHTCVYCTAQLSEDNFVLDHLVPISKGGSNRKHNLVAACEICNRRRSDSDSISFARENYRQQLITQDEFLRLKNYIEVLLAEGD